jgi:crotonobetainyl-CoA:carnitine CoA-transferase CaiB-like acyl-CoA transferase
MIQAMGGAMSLTGDPAGEPMKSGLPIADLFTGMFAVTSILAALRHAERTGEGQHIDISLFDSQIAMLHNFGSAFHATGQEPARHGNAHPSIAPYQVYPTADGHVVLAVGNDGQFRAFCESTNLKLASDPRFATNAARIANRIELSDALNVAMSERTTAYWVAAMEQAGVPCGPINALSQVFADPQAQARGVVETLTRSDGAELKITKSPIRMSQTPPQARAAPPCLGEDTDAVLTELLGADAAALRQWRDKGVI